MNKGPSLKIALIVLFANLVSSLSVGQTYPDAAPNLNVLQRFDSLADQIDVPDIDPRQYIVIYEWDASNRNKIRPSIREKDILRLAEGRLANLERLETDLQQRKTENGEALKNARKRIENIDSLKDKNFVVDRRNQIKALDDRLRNQLSKARQQIEKQRSIVGHLQTVTRRRFEKQKKRQRSKNNVGNGNVGRNNRGNDNIGKNNIGDNNIGKEQEGNDNGRLPDRKKLNRDLPYDYYSPVGEEYGYHQLTQAEYYNDIVWRNAGTPDWTPIWWLNYYPWPTTHYRNIDLKDRDYRDQHFALIPYQKYEVVDKNAVLRIVIDKDQLARNENFRGSIGLEAELIGAGGNSKGGPTQRSIEINPYSVIGEKREVIEFANRPAAELAENLIAMMLRAFEVEHDINEIEDFSNSPTANAKGRLYTLGKEENSFEDLEQLIATLKSLVISNDSVRETNLAKASLTQKMRAAVQQTPSIDPMPKYANLYPYLKEASDRKEDKKELGEWIRDTIIQDTQSLYLILEEAEDLLYRMRNNKNANVRRESIEREERQKEEIINSILHFIKNYNTFIAITEQTAPILDYLGYFETNAGKTRDAFLNLIGFNKIRFSYQLAIQKDYLESLKAIRHQKIDTLNARRMREMSLDNLKALREKLDVVHTLVTTAFTAQDRLYNTLLEINGSKFAEGLSLLYNQYQSELSQSYITKCRPLPSENQDSTNIFERCLNQVMLRAVYQNPKTRAKFRKYIAKKAGEILYQDLAYGTIDLEMADASDGDVLHIRMFWNKEPTLTESSESEGATTREIYDDGDSLLTKVYRSPEREDGIALYGAKFLIRDRGWNLRDQSPIMFINRIREDLLPRNYPLDPTNFEVQGGIGFNWTYRDDFRATKKIRFDDITNRPLFDRYGRLRYRKTELLLSRTAKWLEPSFGIQANFLDFRQGERFEIGIGPTIGIFSNSVIGAFGVNLMETQNRPLYVGVGFDLLRIGKQIQEKTQEQ